MKHVIGIASRLGVAATRHAVASASAADDQAFMDSIYDSVLIAVEQGEEVDAQRICGERDDLVPAVSQLIELARSVTPTKVRQVAPRAPQGYVILGELGRGGMATVYLAQQVNVGHRPVALKMLPDLLTSPSTRERFRREAAAITTLRHRHIVPVHDIVRAGDVFAFAMEFIDGGSLQDVINASLARGTTPILEAVLQSIGAAGKQQPAASYANLVATWGVHICDALHTVHSAGMLHRDLKPSNVLIRSDGTALLSDFGLVRDASDATLTVSGAFAGTACYSSPEQLRATKTLDARSDVYSLGAALYHTLALKRPFMGESAVQVLQQINDTGVPRIRDCDWVPVDLETIVRKAMDVDPARRYATAAEMAADLTRFLSHRPILARRPTLLYRACKFATRYRTQLASGLLASIVVALLCIGVFVRVVLWPRWSNEALLAARSSCIGSAFAFQVFNAEFWEESYDPREVALRTAASPEVRVRLLRAADSYSKTVAFGDDSPQTAAERDAVLRLVDAVLRRPSSQDLRPPAPIVAHYLEWVLPAVPIAEATGASRFDPRKMVVRQDLPFASASEARQIGMIAYVLNDASTALLAWRRLEQLGEVDEFSEGMLGLAMLIRNTPTPAYARLYRAAIAFPEVGEFSMYAADAALRCDDAVMARQFLNVAKATPPVDERGIARLDVMLTLAAGDVAGATSRARQLLTTPYAHASPVLAFQFAQRLESLGGPRETVVEFAAHACMGLMPAGQAVRYFAPRARAYWSQSTLEDRRELVINAITGGVREGRASSWQYCFFVGLQLAREHDAVAHRQWESEQPACASAVDRLWSVVTPERGEVLADLVERAAPDRRVQLADWLLTGEGAMPGELVAP